MIKEEYKLTAYSHGAGCGCKISPAILDTILKKANVQAPFPGLIVGNDERDDAAVFDLNDDTAIVSTTDFFMPIVDDAEDFGRIASVNAISDIYAMGATPLVAIAILGWPINEIPPEVANRVLAGSRIACAEAGIPLAGGHSIDSPEPIFGLAVTGRVDIVNLKRNGGTTPGDRLYLTKGLGVGILSTAQKKKKLQAEHQFIARDSMVTLNKIGALLGTKPYVKAMTDVTGFGLLGHLSEMCEASKVTAMLNIKKIPLLDKSILDHYIKADCIPGGTRRNWASYGHKIAPLSEYEKIVLCDPQTSGGLLVAVEEGSAKAFENLLAAEGLPVESFGRIVAQRDKLVYLEV